MNRAAFAAVTLLIWSASLAHAQSKPNLVKAELLPDVSAIKPGEKFTVGVLLTIERGWHVYWMNPGDSGRATTVKLATPPGFKAEPLKFPVPIKFNQPGDIVGYGYEEQVLLTTEITAPAQLEAGSKVAIGADVVWLSCKEVCIPGKAKLTTALPVSAQAKPANESVFKQWASRFPGDKDPAIKSVKTEAGAAKGEFTHKIEWAEAPPKKVELYPGKDAAIEVTSIAIKSENNQTSATLNARLWPDQKTQAEILPTLLVYTDAKGERHGINLSIPLAGLKDSSQKK